MSFCHKPTKRQKARFRTADRRQLRESGKQLKRYVAISPDPYNRARTKKPVGLTGVDTKMVAGPRIELGTRGFSVPCSTY